MNIPLLVGLAFAVFGIYMLRHAVANYQKAAASQQWPYTTGILTDVRLWGLRNIGGEMIDAEKLMVEYTYEISDQNLTGRSAAFYTLVYPETLEFSKRHPVNSDVKVYYNPDNPSESVLIPGVKKDKPYSELILGLSGAVVGAIIAILGWTGVIG